LAAVSGLPPPIPLEQLPPHEGALQRIYPAWVDALPGHIDYFLFLALFGWALVLVVWWWHPRRSVADAWRWIPWAGGMFVLINATEITLFNILPVGPVTNLWLAADLSHGAFLLLGSAGLWWQRVAPLGRRARILAFVLAATFVVIAVFRRHDSWVGGWVMTAAALSAAASWWAAPGASTWSRVALIVIVLSPLLSNIGPAAAAFSLTRRSLTYSVPGVVDALVQSLGAATVIAGLAREGLRRVGPATKRDFWAELRPFAWLRSCGSRAA
jgi:hypothetical protein